MTGGTTVYQAFPDCGKPKTGDYMQQSRFAGTIFAEQQMNTRTKCGRYPGKSVTTPLSVTVGQIFYSDFHIILYYLCYVDAEHYRHDFGGNIAEYLRFRSEGNRSQDDQ